MRVARDDEQRTTPPTITGAVRRFHCWRPSLSTLTDFVFVVAAVGLIILLRSWVARTGDSAYQEFLRSEWLLLAGGKGLRLDGLSLPLPPLLHIVVAGIVGPAAAERWLPVALSVGIVLVLMRVLLRWYPWQAKALAGVPLLAMPFFYLLQRELDLQLFVLLLGVQLATMRGFRVQPTVGRVTAAVAVNIALTWTHYFAVVPIASAVIYLVLIANREGEVAAAKWRALLWLYIPFSLAGYLIWAVYWVVAGTRLETSFFVRTGAARPQRLHLLLDLFRGELILPLLILLGIAVGLGLFRVRPTTRMRSDRSQAIAWAVLSYMVTALALFALQAGFLALPLLPESITFSLVLLVPAAVGSVYGQARNVVWETGWGERLVLGVAALVVMVVFPLQYLLRPVVLRRGLPPTDLRTEPARAAGRRFAAADPGGRVLVDSRFAASFILAAGINPHRLLTPFDDGFEHVVGSPPDDVRTIVVTDARGDLVGGNYPALRLLEHPADAVLVASGSAKGVYVRAYRRHGFALPTSDVPRARVEPYAATEERLLSEVRKRLGAERLPRRPDGWAYAIDVGNMLIYAAELGDAGFFREVHDVVQKHYLITSLADVNALYTVTWRAWSDRPAEASGTTESLRMAEAYLAAAKRWGNDDLLRLAGSIARGYVQHEEPAGKENRWFIRNYYNYETKQYATNTFTVDYYPNVLLEIARRTDDADMRRVGELSAEFLRDAQHPSGLFYEMYQPEISTIYPDITFFSPNDVSKTYDAVEVALGMVGVETSVAQRALDFARGQYGGLYNEYVLSTMTGRYPPTNLAIFAGIVRLAVALGDPEFGRRVVNERVVPLLDQQLQAPTNASWFFDAITTLLALRELQDAFAKSPVTVTGLRGSWQVPDYQEPDSAGHNFLNNRFVEFLELTQDGKYCVVARDKARECGAYTLDRGDIHFQPPSPLTTETYTLMYLGEQLVLNASGRKSLTLRRAGG